MTRVNQLDGKWIDGKWIEEWLFAAVGGLEVTVGRVGLGLIATTG
jgi:hypothetical protein